MTDQEQEHAADLLNAAMKPFEGQEWYAKVAPRFFDTIVKNIEFKKITDIERLKIDIKDNFSDLSDEDRIQILDYVGKYL